MLNIVGDHATYHQKLDAMKKSDSVTVDLNVSGWIGEATGAEKVGEDAAAAGELSHPGGRRLGAAGNRAHQDSEELTSVKVVRLLGWSRSVHYSPEMTRLIAERNRGLRCATHRHDAADTVQVVERLAPRHQPLSHYRSGQAKLSS